MTQVQPVYRVCIKAETPPSGGVRRSAQKLWKVVAGERNPDTGLIWPDMQRFSGEGAAMPHQTASGHDFRSRPLNVHRFHAIRGDHVKGAPTASTVEPLMWWLRQRAHAIGSLSATLVWIPLPMEDNSPGADEKSSAMKTGEMRRFLDELRADISATRKPDTTHVQTDWSIRHHRRTGSRGGRQQ